MGLVLSALRVGLGNAALLACAPPALSLLHQCHSPTASASCSAPLRPQAYDSTSARQVGLGIATLLACVPPTLGSLHQLNAMNLLAASVVLLHALRRAPAAAGARRALWSVGSGAVQPAGV